MLRKGWWENMKMKDIDFETYLKNYPTKDGYFGKYGGCYVSKELQTAFY